MTINHIVTHWHTYDRVVFMTSDFHGLVEIEFPKENLGVGYIWHLWVDEGYRKEGYATALLNAAEEYIKLQGIATAILEWDKRDTPTHVLEWYERRGYDEKEFGENVVYLEKTL